MGEWRGRIIGSGANGTPGKKRLRVFFLIDDGIVGQNGFDIDRGGKRAPNLFFFENGIVQIPGDEILNGRQVTNPIDVVRISGRPIGVALIGDNDVGFAKSNRLKSLITISGMPVNDAFLPGTAGKIFIIGGQFDPAVFSVFKFVGTIPDWFLEKGRPLALIEMGQVMGGQNG